MARFASDPQLLALATCPGCKKYMLSLVYQCETGHGVCISCRSQNKCPTCEGHLTATRNHSIELLATLLEFPCPYKDDGCQRVLDYGTYKKHETLCEYRTRDCCFCPEDNAWKGPLKQLKKHMLQQHQQYILELDRSYFIRANYLPTSGNKLRLFFIYEDVLFYFDVVCDATNVVYFYMQHIGKVDKDKRYIYNITFWNDHRLHEHRKITYDMECLDDTRSIADGIRMGHYCAVPQRALMNYTNITCSLSSIRTF